MTARLGRKHRRVLALLTTVDAAMLTEDICAITGIRFGAHHPILARLETLGLIRSAWAPEQQRRIYMSPQQYAKSTPGVSADV